MAVAEASCMRSAQLTLGYSSLIGFSHPTALSKPAAAKHAWLADDTYSIETHLSVVCCRTSTKLRLMS